MKGIIIVTHGKLSEFMLESASMFVTNTEAVLPISFVPGQGVEDLIVSIREALTRFTSGDGVLALVDLPGGSPARAAGTVLSESSELLEVVSGVNLPMLVEVLMLRESMSLPELAEYAVASGNDGIVNVGKVLRGGDS
ncbi:PTS sugar transporter subunit IIA [Paenibacillus solisilvae]|uniref:PTS sugar transporter subunit IIA n=1 Tax=Paenibacillus solisilvae TaxID=2486751 RepID=A0ABW0W421_9BACL